MALQTCADTSRSDEELERGTYVRLSDGSYARRIVIVTTPTELDCDDTSLPTSAIRRGAIVRISGNQYALQVIDET